MDMNGVIGFWDAEFKMGNPLYLISFIYPLVWLCGSALLLGLSRPAGAIPAMPWAKEKSSWPLCTLAWMIVAILGTGFIFMVLTFGPHFTPMVVDRFRFPTERPFWVGYFFDRSWPLLAAGWVAALLSFTIGMRFSAKKKESIALTPVHLALLNLFGPGWRRMARFQVGWGSSQATGEYLLFILLFFLNPARLTGPWALVPALFPHLAITFWPILRSRFRSATEGKAP